MSIYNYYTQAVKENLQLSKTELFFKSDPRYQYVLEHVSKNHGAEYLGLIKQEFCDFYKEHKNALINLCRTNDNIGKPIKFYYFDFCQCSPTNLRYIYQSLLIIKHIHKIGLKNLNVIEIGGGYGGLCFFLKNISSLYRINISSYIIYDIPEVEDLQSKYLEYQDIQLDKKENIKKQSFLISNYAFSELPKDIRDKYEREIIKPFCGYGFLAWNGCEFYHFIDDKQISIEEEKPQTHSNNKYIYFR